MARRGAACGSHRRERRAPPALEVNVDKSAVLERFSPFRDATTGMRSAVESAGKPLILPPGAFLFRDGDRCEQFTLVGRGSVRVFKTGETGREITLYHVQAGEICLMNTLCVFPIHDPRGDRRGVGDRSRGREPAAQGVRAPACPRNRARPHPAPGPGRFASAPTTGGERGGVGRVSTPDLRGRAPETLHPAPDGQPRVCD